MKYLIFDPVGGASGDMILASLIELGCPLSHIQGTLELLNLGKPAVILERKKSNGISCLKLTFDIKDEETERSWRDIRDIINSSGLSEGTTDTALNIFGILASAEAKVHGTEIDDVHFHEVGALDSIFDIVGIASAIDWLKPDAVYTTPLPMGTGTVESRHGVIPVPAPATLLLMEGLPVKVTDVRGELVTPTGAAAIKALACTSDIPDCIIKGSGYGCGSKTFPRWPNMFRAMTAETSARSEAVYVIESEIDDMMPEDWGAAIEKIRKAGALDVCIIPCIMKEGRPGSVLRALSPKDKLDDISAAILENTTTIGLRYYPAQRKTLERHEYTLDTAYGKVRIKEVMTPDGTARRKPEYKDIKRLSEEHGIPVAKLREEVSARLTAFQKDEDEAK